MLYAIMGLILLVAVLLILVVLVQNSKGGGLSSQFGGASTQMIGVKKSSDLIEKITWGFVTVLFILTLSTSLFTGVSQKGLDESELEGITPAQQNTQNTNTTETQKDDAKKTETKETEQNK